MSVTDPLKFLVSLIVICFILQACGVIEGPYTPPDGAWSDSEIMDKWHKETWPNLHKE